MCRRIEGVSICAFIIIALIFLDMLQYSQRWVSASLIRDMQKILESLGEKCILLSRTPHQKFAAKSLTIVTEVSQLKKNIYNHLFHDVITIYHAQYQTAIVVRRIE